MQVRSNFYAVDPHPGNFLLMEDGRLGFLDYGQVKRLTEMERITIARLVSAIANGNKEDVIFDTVHIVVKDAKAIHDKATAKGINFARVSDTEVRVSFDEETTEELFEQVRTCI